jgi:hypothetical protein
LKLTVQAVAKMTGLSESTVRQYAWEKKLGKRDGKSKVFTVAEAKEIGGPKNGRRTKQGKRRITSTKKATSARPSRHLSDRKAEVATKVVQERPTEKRRSFWAFLGIGRKPKKKVGIKEASVKK